MVRPTDYLTRAEISRLNRRSTWKGLAAIAWSWGWIGACLAAFCVHPGVLTFLVGWVIVSGRHLGLAILMHDAAHRPLLPSKKWNDRLGAWLAAYPMMTDMQVYRSIHLKHHKATWTEDDPDLSLATALPVTRASFRRKMIRDLTGRTGWQRYRFIARVSAGLSGNGKGLEGATLRSVLTRFARRQYGFLISNAALLAAVSAAGHPEAFFLLWWLPALTGYSVVLRIRNIAEHAVIADPVDPLRNTRTTLAPFWLRFILAPYNVNYHLEHHLFMSVPWYNLPKAHRLLREKGILDRAEVAASYLEVLRKATSAGRDGGPRRPTREAYV